MGEFGLAVFTAVVRIDWPTQLLHGLYSGEFKFIELDMQRTHRGVGYTENGKFYSSFSSSMNSNVYITIKPPSMQCLVTFTGMFSRQTLDVNATLNKNRNKVHKLCIFFWYCNILANWD